MDSRRDDLSFLISPFICIEIGGRLLLFSCFIFYLPLGEIWRFFHYRVLYHIITLQIITAIVWRLFRMVGVYSAMGLHATTRFVGTWREEGSLGPLESISPLAIGPNHSLQSRSSALPHLFASLPTLMYKVVL